MLKEIKLELTNRFGRNCLHCSSRATMDKNKIKELNYQDGVKVLREAKDMGVLNIVFTGGEPLEYPYLADLIALTNSLEMKSTIYSFADKNQENVNKYRELLSLGLNKIVYSLADDLSNTTDKSTILIRDFFDKVFLGYHASLGFHYALTKESFKNYQEKCLRAIEDFKDREYFDKISILRFVRHGRGTKDMALSKEELLDLKEFYQNLKNKEKIRLGSPWNILKVSYSPCIIADEIMIIGYDNIAYPCDSIKYFKDLGIGGNIKENTLEEIYNSTYFKSLREVGKMCSNCLECFGGCLGQKIIESESNDLALILKKKDPGCLK